MTAPARLGAVAVIGNGIIGHGVAQVFAAAGTPVRLVGRRQASLDASPRRNCAARGPRSEWNSVAAGRTQKPGRGGSSPRPLGGDFVTRPETAAAGAGYLPSFSAMS